MFQKNRTYYYFIYIKYFLNTIPKRSIIYNNYIIFLLNKIY